MVSVNVTHIFPGPDHRRQDRERDALYFANDEAERPFYGVSMFESAFYHYDKKTKLYYIAHQRAAGACGTTCRHHEA